MNREAETATTLSKSGRASKAGPDPRQGPGPGVMGAGTLIGNDVYNADEESIGDIKEIMLNMHSGEVDYAVL